MWKNSAVIYFKLPYQHVSGGTEEKHENQSQTIDIPAWIQKGSSQTRSIIWNARFLLSWADYGWLPLLEVFRADGIILSHDYLTKQGVATTEKTAQGPILARRSTSNMSTHNAAFWSFTPFPFPID
jgi:hypothetical protein